MTATSVKPMNTSEQPAGAAPCAGLRVVEMGSLMSAPFCGQILADLGADVIKVENEGTDKVRNGGTMNGSLSVLFENANRGKRSLQVDIKTAEGLNIVRKLALTADVFIQNSRNGVMEKLGLGYEELKADNPRLIYASITGFGPQGPYADLPAYEPIIQAMSGFMPIQGDETPAGIKSPVVDKITAIWASIAILAALHERSVTGKGQKIDVSMLKSFVAYIMPGATERHTFLSPGIEDIPQNISAVLAPWKTSDGNVVGMALERRQFEGLCEGLGRLDLLTDERFLDPPTRLWNWQALGSELAEEVGALTTEAFLKLCAVHSVPFGRVNTLEDLFEDPHVVDQQYFPEFEDEEFGRIRHIAFPADFAGRRIDVRRRAPKLGEHTSEILRDLGETTPAKES